MSETCALSGKNMPEITEEMELEDFSAPQGWSSITVRHRIPNPEFVRLMGMIQAVTTEASANLIAQMDEEPEGDKLKEITDELEYRVRMQYKHAIDSTSPDILEEEEYYIDTTNPSVVRDFTRMLKPLME